VRRPRAEQRLILLRNLAIGFVVLIVALIAAGGLYFGTGLGTPGEWAEGTHYRVQEGAPRPEGPIHVTYFFSYGCIHCRNFEPLLQSWYARQPQDVELVHVPVAFSPTWRLLSQAYYGLAEAGALEQNHDRLFRVIHDQNREFTSAEAVAEFLGGARGMDRDRFLRVMQSPSVRQAVRDADQKVGEYRITSIPALVVDERYVVSMANTTRRQALELVEHLIERAREERRQQAGAGTDSAD
jgi:protein dithiol oxidoreductase (disulfide-forming)